MNEASDQRPEHPGVDAEGVDRSLIREMLQLSPWERLRRLEELVALIQRIREANGIQPVP